MSCCSSTPDKTSLQESRKIDAEIKKTAKTVVHKILLLGAGEAGKSTVFKQMKLLTLAMGEEERKSWILCCRSDCVSGMQTLIKALERTNQTLPPEYDESVRTIMSLKWGSWGPEISQALTHLFDNDLIKKLLQERGQATAYYITDSTEYLLNNLARISADDFVPSNTDIVRTRVRTTGIEEVTLTYKGWNFSMIDVGGQRGERRKWLHCFDRVNAVIYCVALSEYNQTLVEDGSVNRMQESLAVFDGICNSPWCINIPIILFFNKTDIFIEKIKTTNLSVCFPEYTGGPSFEPAALFIQEKFIQQTKHQHSIFPHFTTAIDPENVEMVFQSVKQIILENSLKLSNLG